MTSFDPLYGTVTLLFFIFIIVIGCSCSVKSCDCARRENYKNLSRYLDHLKTHKQIGEPGGILSHLPEQTNCQSKHNLLVQPNVTFKPKEYKDGCTYIKRLYPE